MVMWQAYIIPGKQRWGPNAQQLFFIKSEGCERVQEKPHGRKRERWLYDQVQQGKSLERNTEKRRVLGDTRRHTEYPKIFYKLGYDASRKITTLLEMK